MDSSPNCKVKQNLVMRYDVLTSYIDPIFLRNGVFVMPYNDQKIIRRIVNTLLQEGIDEKYVNKEFDPAQVKTNSLLVYYEESRGSPNYWIKIYRVGKVVGSNAQDSSLKGDEGKKKVGIMSLHLIRDIEKVRPVTFPSFSGWRRHFRK